MSGLSGDDSYFVDHAGDQVFEAAGQGTDVVFAAVDYALAAGQEIEAIAADSNSGLAPINLTGNELANGVTGNAGSNALKGLAGNDTLFGGGGVDAFVFNTALNAATNVDLILDFTPPEDDIILSSGIFTAIAPGTLAVADFLIGTGAADAFDHIIYNSATGALLYDADGLGGIAAIQFATLTGAPAITNADFIVV